MDVKKGNGVTTGVSRNIHGVVNLVIIGGDDLLTFPKNLKFMLSLAQGGARLAQEVQGKRSATKASL